MTIEQISSILHNKEVKELLQAQAIEHIAIAGSYAKGNHTQESDIDLVVDVNNDTVCTSYFTLPSTLEKFLGKRVDLIDKEYINKHIKESLLSDMIPIW